MRLKRKREREREIHCVDGCIGEIERGRESVWMDVVREKEGERYSVCMNV